MCVKINLSTRNDWFHSPSHWVSTILCMNVDSIFSPSVEKKRKQRMKKAGKIEEVAENYNSLVMYYICLVSLLFY